MGRRVWVNLYGHTSPGEFAMANTDLVLAEDSADATLGTHFGRNGHDARTAELVTA